MLKLLLSVVTLLVFFTLLQWLEIEIAYCYRDGSDQLRFAIRGPYQLNYQSTALTTLDWARVARAASSWRRKLRSAPPAAEAGEGQSTIEQLLTGLEAASRLRATIGYLLQRTRVPGLTWITTLGLEDAAATGLMVGLVWCVKGMLVSILQSQLTSAVIRPTIEVIPSFQQACFCTNLHCILSIRVVHLIGGMLQLSFGSRFQRKR
jgi:hypothetical protein